MEDLRGLQDHLVHSVVVVRGGTLVFEEYFPGQKVSLARYTGGGGFDRDDTHNLASVTKSITSTLVGLALDQGFIDSIRTPVFDFFPDYQALVRDDPRRAGMTLEHLLLMTAGLRWNDDTVPYTEPNNDMVRMFNSDDAIGYALSTALFAAPGTEFEYCNANTNILGVAVERATGLRLDAFSDSALFTPLGITDFEWQVVSPEMFLASGDLRLRPRDMAKIGQLFLDEGVWGGEQVVTSEWVQAATARIVVSSEPHAWADGYGYGWWHFDLQGPDGIVPAYAASGWGDQWIFVIPELDMVFVTTGGAYWAPVGLSAEQMLEDYVFRAIR
jgi:CubicO group peptidase (beta-lactamase class C family)